MVYRMWNVAKDVILVYAIQDSTVVINHYL